MKQLATLNYKAKCRKRGTRLLIATEQTSTISRVAISLDTNLQEIDFSNNSK